MDFTINFKTSYPALSLFDNFQEDSGLSLISLIKEKLGLDVPPSTINKSCNIKLQRSEQNIEFKNSKYDTDILKHPSFKHFFQIDVIVPSGWFGQFVIEKVEVERYQSAYHAYDNNGFWIGLIFWWKHSILKREKPYYNTHVTNECDYRTIVDEWFEAGMPHYWGISEERHTEILLTEIICEEDRIKEKERQKELEHLKSSEKSKVDLDYFADELDLMASKLRNIQKVYNN